MIIFLAELTVYDPVTAAEVVLPFSTGHGYTTGPADTPANTFYEPVLEQPASLTRHCFSGGKTGGGSSSTLGNLVLKNPHGALDYLIDYGFDARRLRILRGDDRAAYSTFREQLVCTMVQAEFGLKKVTVKLRGRIAELQKPLQPTKYAGDNSLPNGLEGVEDLKGKPKPILRGRVFNVTPVPVNSSKLIYQVNDGPIASLDAVYDRGLNLVTEELDVLISGGAWSRGAQVPAVGGTPITLSAIAQGNGIFVAARSNAFDGIMTSTDGLDYIVRDAPPANDVAFGAGYFVLVTHTSPEIAYSSDGITWPTVNLTGSIALRKVVYGGGAWVAVGDAGAIYTSTNLTSWTSRTSAHGAANILDVAWNGSKFMLITANAVSTSPDGVTWTARTGTGANWWKSLTNVGARWVATSTNGAGIVTTSDDDGDTWTTQASEANRTFRDVYMNAALGVGIAVGYEGISGDSYATYIVSFDDGDTWSAPADIPEAGPINAAIISNSRVQLLTDFEDLVTSPESYVFYAATGYVEYASEADLLDDALAPQAGSVGVYLAGGYFRLGGAPDGLVTADVTEGESSADRTAAQIWKSVLITNGGMGAPDYSSGDITALDTADNSEIGFYAVEETTVAEVLDKIAATPAAWWGADREGVFRIEQLTVPAGAGSFTFAEIDVKGMERVASSDEGNGLPVFQTILRYGRNYTVQDSDLAGSVTPERRGELSKQWKEVTATDASVKTKHPLAPEVIEETLYAFEADAQAEANRRQAMRGTRRDRNRVTMQLTDATDAVDLGNGGTVTHHRFGLAGGKPVRIIGVDPDAAKQRVTFTVWG